MNDALQGGSRPGHRGFTLIELMIVIAIIAVIAAIAIPNLIEARKGSNEAAAIGALRTLTTAQALFREGDKDGNGVHDYATSLPALVSSGLIDGELGSGTKQGYHFEISIPDGKSSQFFWEVTATPITPGKSGDRSFFVDETGVLRFSNPCPPGYVPVNDSHGKIICEPSSTATTASQPIGGKVAVETLELAHGGLLPTAKDLAGNASFVRSALMGLDADGNGQLTFGEVLGADLVQLARELARQVPSGGDPIGDDGWLQTVTQRFQAELRRSLALGGDEKVLPAVQIDGLQGHPAALLELAAADPRYASLDVLQGLLQQLQASDMTATGEQAARQREMLVAAADGLPELLRFGEIDQLRQHLTWIRDRARSWVVDATAGEIAHRVGESLKLIGGTVRR